MRDDLDSKNSSIGAFSGIRLFRFYEIHFAEMERLSGSLSSSDANLGDLYKQTGSFLGIIGSSVNANAGVLK